MKQKRSYIFVVWVLLGASGSFFASCERRAAEDLGASAGKGESNVNITVTSSAFANGAAIPVRYTGEGQDISPPLQWTGVPAGAKELALICDDPDAPRPEPWVHWVVYKIPPTVGGLSEGISPGPQLSKPFGAVHGKSTTNELSYHGPNPPRGHGVHHYHFKVYALDCELNLQPGASKDQLLAAMKGHILAEGELIGTYKRD